MRKKRTLLICATCALLALLAYSRVEPSYGGHPLNYWVAILGSPGGFGGGVGQYPGFGAHNPDFSKATNAINHIGVAALPFLIKWIQYERPSRRRLELFEKLVENPFPPVRSLSRWICDPKDFERAWGACEAFDALGTQAMPAFDELCRLLNDKRPDTADRAALALGYFGTNALPKLQAVAARDNPACICAVLAMKEIRTRAPDPDPEPSVPTLISRLKDPNAYVRQYSAIALGLFGSQAASAIPALTNVLADSDPGVRERAAKALHQIDPTTFTNASSQ